MNMNIMGWVYGKMADAIGSPGHIALGASLMIGKYEGIVVQLAQGKDLKMANEQAK